jgi:hypothetical protein
MFVWTIGGQVNVGRARVAISFGFEIDHLSEVCRARGTIRVRTEEGVTFLLDVNDPRRVSVLDRVIDNEMLIGGGKYRICHQLFHNLLINKGRGGHGLEQYIICHQIYAQTASVSVLFVQQNLDGQERPPQVQEVPSRVVTDSLDQRRGLPVQSGLVEENRGRLPSRAYRHRGPKPCTMFARHGRRSRRPHAQADGL